jgi:alkylation response protein AidB-like acyl-CoA dehydrogenase
MELDPTEEQRFFQETTRKFLDSEMPTSRVRELAKTSDGFDSAWWRRGAELGWTSLLVAEADGGGTLSGNGMADLAIVAEEFGRSVSPGPLFGTNICAQIISRRGTTQQRTEILPGLLDGNTVGAWCFHETSRPWSSLGRSFSVAASHDGYLLNGTKIAVEYGAQADVLLVSAADTNGQKSQFLLRAETPGITIKSKDAIDLVKRYADVHFDNVHVDRSAVIGLIGQADADIEDQLQTMIALQCCEIVGAAGKVFEFTLAYTFDRYSFGRPLASYQALKHRFADMKTWLEASYATALTAAVAVGANNVNPDATTTPATTQSPSSSSKLVSVAKAYVADRCPEIIQDCIQMHGGIGVTWEHDLHLYLRRVVANAGTFGTVDDHRERVAAACGL